MLRGDIALVGFGPLGPTTFGAAGSRLGLTMFLTPKFHVGPWDHDS